MPATTAPMKDIYQRLQRLGFPRKFIRENILPDWWDDTLAAVPANRAQAEMILSRQLGLELRALRDPQADLQLPEYHVKLRHRGRVPRR